MARRVGKRPDGTRMKRSGSRRNAEAAVCDPRVTGIHPGGAASRRCTRVIWSSHILWKQRVGMKTTLNLNDQVLRQAKGRAARDGITLTKFVEDALRARLASVGGRTAPFKLRLETVSGDRPPNVDIDDRDALYDVIDRP